MQKHTNNLKKAFTLVEMMIALAIFSIVLFIGYTMLNRTFLSMERQRQSLDTLHEARSFLMNIERDIREMVEVVELDTIFSEYLFNERYALLHKITMLVPARDGKTLRKVTYSYEGPEYHQEIGRAKIVYRQEEGGVKKALITKQMDYLKVWGTDGTIFRSREKTESESNYVAYLTKHYYNPSNPVSDGLRKLEDIKGIEVQLSMHELFDKDNKPVKQRKFITRIYPRILNAKYE